MLKVFFFQKLKTFLFCFLSKNRPKKHLLLLIVISIQTIFFGQNLYEYKFRVKLKSQPSKYTIKTKDTILGKNKGILNFQVINNNGDTIPFVVIKIKNILIDTSIWSDFNGFASIVLPSGIFSINIAYISYNHITIEKLTVKENTSYNIKISLGKSSTLNIYHIYSVRKLRKKEIKKLVDDLKNDNTENNELIKNATCQIMMEI
jgi:hypothetical protein